MSPTIDPPNSHPASSPLASWQRDFEEEEKSQGYFVDGSRAAAGLAATMYKTGTFHLPIYVKR